MRTLTTVVGIALGVGVVVAIQLTNASSVRGFETALDTVAGKATIEIVGRGGIDETWLTALGWLRKFGAASPVIEGEMALIQGDEARVGAVLKRSRCSALTSSATSRCATMSSQRPSA